MASERIVIVGGHPTATEVAAVTAALIRHVTIERAATRATHRSRWIRAARLEGCGHPPVDAPGRLTR